MSLRLGDDAPDFTAETTDGEVSFHDYLGDGLGRPPVLTTTFRQAISLWSRRILLGWPSTVKRLKKSGSGSAIPLPDLSPKIGL